MAEKKRKQLKLLYYAQNGTELQEINIGWKKILTMAVVSLSLLLLLVSFVLGLFSQLSQNWQVMSLARAHKKLSNLISDMNNRVNNIEGLIEHIEHQDSSLKVFADVPSVSQASSVTPASLAGLSAPEKLATIDRFDEALQMKRIIDNLADRIEKARQSRAEISENYQSKLQQLRQTPSVRPLWGGRITDKYGYRLDPLVDRVMYHEGIDFSAPRGTEVLASADGVVKEVVTRFRPYNDFGRYVLIDHGYGRQTRYAHLETVNVRAGQQVTRHTVIGRVGDTGRSTGPHLHYEVLQFGKPVDPANFILE
jgi:murein DD-endopeptidase MepM/ murein hydrolase activator NlpD